MKSSLRFSPAGVKHWTLEVAENVYVPTRSTSSMACNNVSTQCPFHTNACHTVNLVSCKANDTSYKWHSIWPCGSMWQSKRQLTMTAVATRKFVELQDDNVRYVRYVFKPTFLKQNKFNFEIEEAQLCLG